MDRINYLSSMLSCDVCIRTKMQYRKEKETARRGRTASVGGCDVRSAKAGRQNPPHRITAGGRLFLPARFELLFGEFGDHFPRALTEIEVPGLDGVLRLLAHTLRLDDDMETAAPVTDEFRGHSMKPARLVFDMGAEDTDGDIDTLEVSLLRLETRGLKEQLPHGLTFVVQPLRLKQVANMPLHRHVPVGQRTGQTGCLVLADSAQLQHSNTLFLNFHAILLMFYLFHTECMAKGPK